MKYPVPVSRRALLRASATPLVARADIPGTQREDGLDGFGLQGAPELGYPIMLSSTCVLKPGAQLSPNTKALQAPDGCAIEIYAMRFSLVTEAPELVGRDDKRGNAGNAVLMRLDMGGFKLTNGYVPIGCFGQFQDTDIGFADTSSLLCPSNYEWRLAKPLYVPVGSVVAPTFLNRGIDSLDVTVNICYIARVVKNPSAGKLCIPYACAFIPPAFEIATQTSGASTETELVNATEKPFILQRMSAAVTLRTKYSSTSVVSANILLTEEADFDLVKVRIVDSQGQPVSPNFSYMSSMLGRSPWEMVGAVIPPDGYYKVYWENDITDVTPSYTVDSNIQNLALECFFSMALIGYYEVDRRVTK